MRRCRRSAVSCLCHLWLVVPKSRLVTPMTSLSIRPPCPLAFPDVARTMSLIDSAEVFESNIGITMILLCYSALSGKF